MFSITTDLIQTSSANTTFILNTATNAFVHNENDSNEFESGVSNFEFDDDSAFMSNASFKNETFTEYAEIPYYIKATSMTFCIVIMCLGVIGNVMVPIVILKTKDMRNSTNIFLVNLSIADLMVLLVCTPTVLVEVNSKPETWVLGKELCLAVPFVELTVAHASVLTILAISFERYYAICEPLRAGYVCTKTRATLICALAWFFAALFTSPILAIAEHRTLDREDGPEAQCLTQAVTFWQITFFVMVITCLYLIPLFILIILYTIIAKNLINAASKVVMNKTVDPYNARARRQVILMLGTVVLCFFVCLMPYRILAMWIIITPSEITQNVNPEKWYNMLYFSRIMLYINSAINPILYNLMSSKFRLGFCKVCICYADSVLSVRKRRLRVRAGTLTTGSTNSSSLTRTTNSLKKLFSHRSSGTNAIEVDEEADEKNRFLKLIFTKRRFIRQQSAPVCSKMKPPNKFNRMRSEGSMPRPVAHNKTNPGQAGPNDNAKCIGHSKDGAIKNNADVDLFRHGSLRRSVLINSMKTKSMDCEFVNQSTCEKGSVCVIAFKKSKSFDSDFPESYV